MDYKNLAENPLSTIAAEYQPRPQERADYQSEVALEAEFIRLLQAQGYDYLPIKTEKDLLANLRAQMEALNAYHFSDSEWEQFRNSYLLNKNDGVLEKTAKIQENSVYELKAEDGSLKKNIRIIDKKHLGRNRLQVINQYEAEGEGATGAARKNRYDVTILVNGLPLVHIELKRRGVALKEAFNQINRYKRDSFWAASGLFEYAQIFVISNGTHTKYYANTVRKGLCEAKAENRGKAGDSFEFTSWWADMHNRHIADLTDFAKTFFGRRNLLNIVTKYCVFDTDKNLKIMRPYQIAATEKILNKIALSFNHKLYGTIKGGGYIWHTTGSGKTLTSFKCATLARDMDCVEKVLFVVDRKDLDYQTIREYERFQKDCVKANKSTKELAEQLSRTDRQSRIIITTIQKLDRFIDGHKNHTLYDKPIALIFDECHRSQFGDMQRKITLAFKKYFMFGFTGTPIFPVNAAAAGVSAKTLAQKSSAAGNAGLLRTTEQVFGCQLHTYTILDAIHDENVLKFRVDYFDTVKSRDGIIDKQVTAIDRQKALLAPERISQVAAYIVEHFDQKTLRSSPYTLGQKRLRGFNSIFAVSSIEAAKLYYRELLKLQGGLPLEKRLKLGLIYSFGANEAESETAAEDYTLPEEDFEPAKLDISARDFLDGAIKQYNADFGMNFDTSSDSFQKYYKDLSRRVKDREVDLLIVVNMFLTGFDAKTLNTLWVDKDLRYHGLLQAFSRTNRILNSTKAYGNIVCFRNLEEQTNKALALFSNEQAGGIVLLKTFAEYYDGYEEDGKQSQGYKSLIAELTEQFPLGQAIIGEEAEKHFIRLFGSILKLKNILGGFDDFAGREILSAAQFQDYQSLYLDLHDKLPKSPSGEAEIINDDIVFEMELVKQVTYNIDYILQLMVEYQKSQGKDKELLAVAIGRAVNSSPELRSKKELIDNFIGGLQAQGDVYDAWHDFVKDHKTDDLQKIIAEENLQPEKTKKFVAMSFRNGAIDDEGTDLEECLPPAGWIGGARQKKKQTVLEKLRAFFEKYCGI